MSNDKQTPQYKAREYIYDLGNAALENGFKPDERWEVSLATMAEKKAIEKQYHPTVATTMLPELLNAAFRLVKTQLKQAIKERPVVADRFAVPPVYQYLVAYNPDRLRR
ncbi:MAG: hypothetical protein JWQ34_3390 [Mucilaginibacter sp.]|uniref:hypothetical protein n=1 Tax=Mucilaginibacter sp. TaxID=1882438 RepID=UPI00260FB23D|nr:hypothetical protein [Mucilaginibacter sp.]MDB5005165.1 hypothetical protein [Mucilaginibacter sp.]